MKPIAITLGDPAGIGAEVAAKWLAQLQVEKNLQQDTPWLLVGTPWALEAGAQVAGVSLPNIATVTKVEDVTATISLYDIGLNKPADFRWGEVQAACGRVAVESVEWAAKACLANQLDAMVTCPLNKEAIHAAGFVDDLGHQEILARLSGASWTATMLMTPGLRVAHLSTHKSLIKAAQYVTKEAVLEKLRLIESTVTQWGIAAPRIAVAALNPHGGEGGILGREEIEEIAPAVAQAVALGINVVGAIPADSVFTRAINGEFDVVLALYHDQGHIAIKVHNFHESTTATLGLPFVRTSVDHGTAFDIAGKGVADPTGLQAALTTAQQIVNGALE
ncbi:MAG: 4-hydroxythreonine-4-phosphate dehydrogenase PdxA [Gammaproteobacteria bacterium]|nr:4-hydroxythreonine-4-phosphate dehydrogenase PdxA [Gammaproteobacteria bacterium]